MVRLLLLGGLDEGFYFEFFDGEGLFGGEGVGGVGKVSCWERRRGRFRGGRLRFNNFGELLLIFYFYFLDLRKHLLLILLYLLMTTLSQLYYLLEFPSRRVAVEKLRRCHNPYSVSFLEIMLR